MTNSNRMRYFRVKNFDTYQPMRHGKYAPWIRLYASWNNDWAIGQLVDSHKAHFIGLLLIAHATDNKIPWDSGWIKKQIQAKSNVKLDVFEKLGLIEILDNNDEKIKKQNDLEKRGEEKKKDIENKNTQNEKHYDNQMLNFYKNTYKKKFGTDVLIKWEKDRKLLKEAVDLYGEEKTKELIAAFFDMNDAWVNNNGRGVNIFHSQLNKLDAVNTKAHDPYGGVVL